MIDFRYHVVSLISVFLALAVGIVLGAGPLKESLGAQLAQQVEQLRTEKETLRATADQRTRENDAMSSFIVKSGPQLLGDRLNDQTVVLVADDQSIRKPVDEIDTLIQGAGGRVPVRLVVTQKLWDPAQESARTSALASIHQKVPSLSLPSDSTSRALATAIGIALGGGTAIDLPTRQSILNTLAEQGMVAIDGNLTGIPDGAVYATADPAQFQVPGDDSQTAAKRASSLGLVQTSLVTRLSTDRHPLVVAGVSPASDDVGLLRTLRTDETYIGVSTVDGLDRADGQVVSTMALVERLRGRAGDYGTSTGARGRLPDLATLPAPSNHPDADKSQPNPRGEDGKAQDRTGGENPPGSAEPSGHGTGATSGTTP
ncbi:copper transporter [Devriesea agamarum]|uniref:copper transporter n=1 Tax=Devriesea agamarum TaxID=472569 RepID=UPI00071E4CCC|nr:copper transporter [Devriesea agamarum]